MSHLNRRSALALLAATLGAAPLSALAQGQTPVVPQDMLNNTRPVQGDSIRICLDTLSVARAFDEAVASAIAGILLLKPVVGDAPSGFPMDGLGFMEELQITMNNDCDLLAGIALQPGVPFPEWASVSRAYATIPFVLVVSDPAFATLSDIPLDRRIGTAMGSLGELVFLAHNAAQPADRQRRRLPYADPAKMLERLKDGTLGGIILWQPVLRGLTNGDLAAAGVRVIPADGLPPMNVSVGALVSGRDAFLRSSVDDAIAALIADGSIQALLDRFGYAGIPGP